ncbi:TPA: hypothetical protein DCR49_00910 [Candidatus Delongbacteria bacterium]|nr:MAG: hypothetical protein A2Y39_02185 [Candidatus Delongbacteria bacterium GWF2_40_14]HAQ60559.1 hypothetical protein [Candidatus Delongbacteria bacterium]
MKQVFAMFLIIFIVQSAAETLFEVKDSSDHTVLNVSTDGLAVMNQGDTIMVISTTEIKAVIDDSKALSRKFSVSTTSAKKGVYTDLFDVTLGSATMRGGSFGERYADFSPQNMFLGLDAGVATTPSGTTSGQFNVFLGNNAGITNYSGYRNVFIGENAGRKNYSGYANLIIGHNAGYNNTGSQNLFIGGSAGYDNTTGYLNTYVGNAAGYKQTSGYYNTYLGYTPAYYKTGGNENTILGSFAGLNNSSGSGNVFIGYSAGYNEAGSNKLYISNSDTSTPLIHGDFSAGNIGLGKLASTSYRLDVLHSTSAGNFEANSYGTATRGLYARAYNGTSSNYGIFASASGAGTNYAGYFSGNVYVTGNLYANDYIEFKSDHPLDPGNKILSHSSVSSNEMLNVYSGNVVLDEEGNAIVEMPDWFEAYNAEFRYQLTGIGSSAPGLFVSEELKGGRFGIGGGNPGMKVSWMVTAVRNDNYAKSNPIQIVSDKKDNEKGYYLTPEVFGKSIDIGIENMYEREAGKKQNE